MGQAGSCGTAGRAAHGGVRTRTEADAEPPKSLAAPQPRSQLSFPGGAGGGTSSAVWVYHPSNS